MPIANCIVARGCRRPEDDLAALWARETGESSEHMTVNLIVADAQYGRPYRVMATLYLPSVWSAAAVASLQVGLAKALATGLNEALDGIHVITHIIESGSVVESGNVVTW